MRPDGPRRIRPARPDDTDALYEICLRTGDHGQDASALYREPRLIGEVYVGPYLALAPDLAFVLTGADDVPLGYVLGVEDSLTFEAQCERSWWPPLRERYPLEASTGAEASGADAGMIRLIHAPPSTPPEVAERYPAHLHVDVLPAGQGGGDGRRLLETLFTALRERGVPGVHLGVSARNPHAIGFYRHLGFRTLTSDADGALLALPLP